MEIEIVDLAGLANDALTERLAADLAAWHVGEWGHLYDEAVWNRPKALDEFFAMASPESTDRTLLAFAGPPSSDTLIGSVCLLADDDLAGWGDTTPWLASLFVRPAARGASVGAMLVDRCVELARLRGHEMLHLFTAGQERYYLERGWRTIGSASANGEPAAVMAKATSPRGARRCVTTDWNVNPLYRGAYSLIAPGGSPADRDRCATAVGPRIWLAGEYTWSAHPGTLHGAWFSGERAARQALDALVIESAAESAAAARGPQLVAVVGAGFAGIAAARVVTDSGHHAVVFEASPFVGGRSRVDRSLGGPVHLGGAWLHGVEGHPVHGAVSAEPWAWDDVPTFVAGHGRLAGADEERLSAVFDSLLPDAADADESRALGPVLRSRLSALDCSAVDRAVLASWARSEFQNLYAAPIDELSLRWSTEEYSLPGGDHLITSGLDEFVADRTADLDVRTEARVVAVEQEADGVTVVLADGARHRAAAAICAVPLPQVRDGVIRFDPPLPDTLRGSLALLNHGPVAKVFATFDERWWGELRYFSLCDAAAQLPLEFWVDVSSLTGRPTLQAFAVGEHAAAVESMSEHERCRLIDGLLSACRVVER